MSRNVTRTRALIALLLLVPAPSLGSAMGLWVAPGPVGKTVYAVCKIWILVLPLVWLLAVERGKLSLSPARRGGFGFGVLSGVLIGALIVGAYYLFAAAQIDPATLRELAAANGFDRRPVFLAFAAYLILVNALLEEYVWRWFVYTRWETIVAGPVAVALAAVCFTLHHILVLASFVPWSLTILGASGVFVGGVVWSWSYRRYRSIWPGYVSHAIVDAAILALGWRLLFSPA